jgi:hypothetical protein
VKLSFEWDPAKAASNYSKHRISFEEASSVFFDPLALIFADPNHSFEEQREIIIGLSSRRRLLLVSFKQVDSSRVRIISARQTTRHEKNDYQDNS